MTETKTEPGYVNLQPGSVRVFDERRVPVEVQSWSRRGTIAGATFVVRGAHYQQFVSGSGPLYPFPGNPAEMDSATVQKAARDEKHAHTMAAKDDAHMAAARGRMRFSATTVREGEVVGQTDAAFLESVRRELAARGIRTAETFQQAAAPILLSCESITEANLVRVRESIQEIFPKGHINPGKSAATHAPTASVPSPLPADEVVEAPALLDLDTQTDDFKEGEEESEGEGYRQYKRTDVEALTLSKLKAAIEREDFEIDLKQRKDELSAAFLLALEEYEMLIEE